MNKTELHSVLSFAPLLEHYFLSYLIAQKKASPQTVATYRDSFTLYLEFLSTINHINPENIEMEHFSLHYLESFGEHLEHERLCCSSTINLRMASIKSFLRYAAVEAPEYSDIIRKSLSLPCRKADKPVMAFLKKEEYEAMLEICEENNAISLRDKLMIMILYNTGCRVSELISVQVSDVSISHDSGTSSIHFWGKGRKERITPIWKTSARYIEQYIESQGLEQKNRLFKNKQGRNLTRSGVSQRITLLATKASSIAPSLKEKKITPHTFRHSAAMNLLQAGVDISTIAIWLGHESIETTHKYMVADIETKRKAMEKLEEPVNGTFNYKPSKSILSFLESL